MSDYEEEETELGVMPSIELTCPPFFPVTHAEWEAQTIKGQ